jgi:hypothetical protein
MLNALHNVSRYESNRDNTSVTEDLYEHRGGEHRNNPSVSRGRHRLRALTDSRSYFFRGFLKHSRIIISASTPFMISDLSQRSTNNEPRFHLVRLTTIFRLWGLVVRVPGC